MAVIRLNTNLITDWASFHLVCKEAFGFPEFYGRNMNAWIDCMSCLIVDEEMTKFLLKEDEVLHIEITNTEDFNSHLSEILIALVECSAFVNNRYIEAGKSPKVSLVFL